MLYLLGPQAFAAMLISSSVGGGLLRTGLGSGRTALYERLRKRKYRSLLRSEAHNWSPTFDLERTAPGRVGLIGIGLAGRSRMPRALGLAYVKD